MIATPINMVVACDNNTADGTDVQVACAPAPSWGAAKLIETDNSGGADTPQIAMNANGKAIALMKQPSRH